MYEESRSKFVNLKKRAKFAVGKLDNNETLGFKKKKFGGIDNRGKVKRGEIKLNVEDDEFRRRNDRKSSGGSYRGKRGEGDDSRGKFSEGRRTERRGGRENEKQGWEAVLSKRGPRGDGNRMFNRTFGDRGSRGNGETRTFSDRGSRGNGENRVFNRRDSRDGGENRTFSDRGSQGNGENRMFNRRDSLDGGGGDRRIDTENGENRTFSDRGSRGNGENRMFNRRDLHEGGGGRRNGTENGANRTFSDRGSRDGRGDRRNNSENGDNRSGLLRKNGVAKDENSEKLQSPSEDQEVGRKKFYKKYLAAGDSMTSFERPKRKRRLIRIAYRNDTANKRFDDTIPTIAPTDNTTKQKEDSDTEEIGENPEMSQNAQFRAIQPTPAIISFVNENLLGRRREIDFRKAGYNIELPSPLDDIPFSTSSDRAKIEESVFRNKLEFFAAAKVSSSFPSPDLPEIAFAGRSNVGKSSLLNSLTRQWGVVRTSDKPGLTQTINFFNLGTKLCLVDLPGYGFAYAKDEVKESWEELVKEYVTTREGLKRVCLLIDTKWGMKARDHELVDLMERSKTKYQIVLTKTDLSFPVDVARRAMQIEESLKTKKSALQPLMMVSSKTGAGIRTLRTVLSNVSRFARL